MGIQQFKLEIEPEHYGDRGNEYEVLRVRMLIDGQEFGLRYVPRDQRVWESEIGMFLRHAIAEFEAAVIRVQDGTARKGQGSCSGCRFNHDFGCVK